MGKQILTPAQSAVAAFVGLVTAIRQGNREWAHRERKLLERVGITVGVKRDSPVLCQQQEAAECSR